MRRHATPGEARWAARAEAAAAGIPKDKVLVEASPRDRIWGIGLPETDSRAANPLTRRGLNLLGFALMSARSRLAAAKERIVAHPCASSPCRFPS